MPKYVRSTIVCLTAMNIGSLAVFSAGIMMCSVANAQSNGETATRPWDSLRSADDVMMSTEPVFQELESTDSSVNTLSEPQSLTNNLVLEDQLQGRSRRVESEAGVLDDADLAAPSARANVRAGQVEAGNSRAASEDPFAAQGFSVGSWQANASVEQSIGYSSNLERSAAGAGGAFSSTNFNLGLQSDWSQHQAQVNASAAYQRNFDDEATAIPLAGISGSLRLDVQDGVSLTIATGYNYSTEAITSTLIGAVVDERPGTHNITGSVEYSNTAQRLNFNLRGSVDRSVFENASLSSGSVLNQKDRNNNLYLTTARVGYEVSPSLTPFVEGRVGIRDFDLNTDRNGQATGSNIYGFSIGAEVDLGEKLDGEIAIGYQVENFSDAALENLEGFTIDASLNWSPWRETVVGLTASTNFQGSTGAGQSGAIVHAIGGSVERQVNDRLALRVAAGVDITRASNGDSNNYLLSTGAGFEYSINKNLALTGDITLERQTSSNALQGYNASTVEAGVRWQK